MVSSQVPRDFGIKPAPKRKGSEIMKRPILLALIAAVLGFGLGYGVAWAGDAEALQAIKTYRFGQSREPLTVVEDLVRAALASPEQRKALAAQLAGLLATDATLECKDFVCRQLVLIGTGEEVPALAALLAKPETADMARYALERIPERETGKALLDALPQASGKAKIGIMNSLGERRAAKAVAALKKSSVDSDAAVAEAALAALGKIGGKTAAGALADVRPKVVAENQSAWADAYLRCADNLSAEGKARAAVRIYEALYVPAESQRVRVAAFQGLVSAKGPQAIDMVIGALTGTDPILQGVATGSVRSMSSPEATEAFARQLPRLDQNGQVRLLTALADRGDKAALPAVNEAAASADESVRVAAIEAMARLGDASSVVKLAERAAQSKGREAEAARNSLCTLQGTNVDAAILTHAKLGDANVRVELLKATVPRNMTAAVPVLISMTDDGNGLVRSAAFKALPALAGPGDVASLLARLAKGVSDDERSAAEDAVAAAVKKIPMEDKPAAQVMATLARAADVKLRASLLKVLGDVGDPTALDALRSAVKDADADVQSTAVRALSQWPAAEVLDDLLVIAEKTRNDTHRVLAMRGYARLLALPGDRAADVTIAKYKEVLRLAKRDEERRTILAGLADVKDPRALKLAEPYLADDAVRPEAAAAMLKVGQAVCGAYPQEAKAAVQKVLAKATDENVQKQGRTVLETIERFAGYITAWRVSGPYLQEGTGGSELFDVAFPPEDPGAAGVEWTIMPASKDPDQPWLMDLDVAIGGGNRAAYLRTVVVSPKEQDARVELGSDDGVKVWLNGDVVHANNVSRGVTPGEDVFPVKLRKGDNTLLLKVVNGGGDWGACARLRTPDGNELEGIKYRPE